MKEQNKNKIYHNFYSHLTKTLNFFFLKWTTVHDLATCFSSGSAGHWPGHNRTPWPEASCVPGQDHVFSKRLDYGLKDRMVTYYTEWGEDQTVRECVQWTMFEIARLLEVQCLKFLLFHYRSFVGTGTRPANYPNANRYIEALVKRPTALHCPARIGSGPCPVSLRLDPASSCATKPDPQPAIPQNQ